MKEKNITTHGPVEIEEGTEIGKGTVVWHNSQIKKGAIIGEDCVIGHNCFINPGARIGNGVKLESNIDLWDKVVLEDYVFVGPSAVFTNDLNHRAKYPKKKFPQYGEWKSTIIEEGASIGANATIICGNNIGKWALVGAGSVVTKNIPNYALAYGNPAKVNDWVCECGNKLNFESNKAVCKVCNKEYIKEDDKVHKVE